MNPFQRRQLTALISKRHRVLLDLYTSPPIQNQAQRCYVAPAATTEVCKRPVKSLAVPAQARFNEIGVQQLADHVHAQIFPHLSPEAPPELIELSKNHLSRHELLGKTQEPAPPVAFNLPPLQGLTLDEHFYKLGMDAAEPYLDLAKRLALGNTPPRPRKWVQRSGWTKYYPDGTTEHVDAPQEPSLTFDTEVMWKETSFACMACAVSPTAWYAWISPWLLKESKSDRHLIPMGDPATPRIIIGHNIGYDRARVAEEYNLQQTKNFFLDTMSLHVAVNGMCSRQRPTWVKHRKNRELRDEIAKSDQAVELAVLLESGSMADEEEELWVGRSSINSLRDVARFHCGINIDKARREHFGELDRDGIIAQLDELLDYCAADVEVTHKVYRKVFPLFLETCPHPVSFAALRHLSAEILPTNKSWESYIANAEATYQKLSSGVTERLEKLANKALKDRKNPQTITNDPWLSQLDWSGQEVRMLKAKKGEKPKSATNQKMPGMPQWYKGLFLTRDSPINLTVRTRVAPLLLRLAWDGYPLFWSDLHGWTYRVPILEVSKLHQQGLQECDMSDEKNLNLRDDRRHRYFKLPHKDGPGARCVSPLAKGYLQFFEQGKLSSEYSYAKAALEMNASCSYWISARDRIMNQMLVYADEANAPLETNKRRTKNSLGFILPQVIPMGTITRRAIENTWLTASNAKVNRVGSELKSMIQAPNGYCFVGADVDSQELWIASLVGDAQFKLHGGSAIGFMTLEGTKAAGTDLHSRTAKILGISRNDAKVFNYGRIYGAGQKFAAQLLRQFNPTLPEAQAQSTAGQLYMETKGKKITRRTLHERGFWRGGTESLVFNRLEDFAEQSQPRTPILAAGITEALMRRYISKGGFLTSRINWAIQSSGVDYLHLLIVSMEYLIRRFNLQARLAITVHDEIRYLVKDEDKYRAAMALQIANVWTRAMFAQQLGINDLPQSCAYFSAVDIDHVLRKEVDMECVTPSHPKKIPPGESLDISQLLEKGEEAQLDEKLVPADPPQVSRFTYVSRTPVIKLLEANDDAHFLRAQITSDDTELRAIVKDKQTAVSLAVKADTAAAISKSKPGSIRPRGGRIKDGTTHSQKEMVQHRLNYQQHPNLLPVDNPWNQPLPGKPFFRGPWEKARTASGWAGYSAGLKCRPDGRL